MPVLEDEDLYLIRGQLEALRALADRIEDDVTDLYYDLLIEEDESVE